MRRKVFLTTSLVALVVETLFVGRRRGRLLGAETVVRCQRGHLFTTLWIPGASVKSLRLVWWRLQHCPVGSHWSLVTPVQVSEMSDQERRLAAANHDIRLP